LQLALALRPFCPPPAPGSASYPVPEVRPAADAIPLDLPPEDTPTADPASSGRLFRLPPEKAAIPTRRRAKAGFPVGPLLVAAGGLLLLGVLGYAAYRAFTAGGPDAAPVESFTNSAGMRMVRLAGRHGRPVRVRRAAHPETGPVRGGGPAGVAGQGRADRGERMGPLRHARERGRVVPGLLPAGLPGRRPAGQPARPGRRRPP